MPDGGGESDDNCYSRGLRFEFYYVSRVISAAVRLCPANVEKMEV
jgi:hypothetical protein